MRCHNKEKGKKVVAAVKKTNADWVKSAANYDLLDDEKPTRVPVEAKKPAPAPAPRNEPPPQITIQKDKVKKEKRSKDDKRSSRRRRADLSSSSSEDEHAHENVRTKYEQNVETRRQNRDKRRQRSRSTSSNEDNGFEGTNHISEAEDEYLTEQQKVDREREMDIKERDEFAKRLLDRDSNKTSKPNAEKDDGADHLKRVDMEQRLAKGETVYDETTGDEITLASLREESRRSYLKKRTEREITLLERELADEEEMFDAEKLTGAERNRLALRKEVLKLAKGDSQKDEKDNGFYRLPDDYEELEGRTKAEKDSALLKSRYVEEKYEKSEQQLWEEEQTKKASVGYGKKGKRKDEKAYDLVFDDHIDFVMTDKNKGYDNRKKKSGRRRRGGDDDSASSRSMSLEREETAIAVEKPLTAHEKILIGRKKLPVFPYREEFLSAVKDHQIMILVGETGSGKT